MRLERIHKKHCLVGMCRIDERKNNIYRRNFNKMNYIKEFEKLGFGLFVHFGLYSALGKGEWSRNFCGVPAAEYEKLTERFKVNKNWAAELVKTAKAAGCRYVALTSRHHEGFSLYDTRGLSDYDAPHSACGRDLIAEFTESCRGAGLRPFFYHTLLDWHHPDYNRNFSAYIDYLADSIEILCKNYGEIGGFWFDGMWDKPKADWQQDRLYAVIRKYQPRAMIINNTGLSQQGKVAHPEIDGVTFERGNPSFLDHSDKYRAGEMCQVLNDHWGYTKDDCNYKSVKELLENLVDCRRCNCNFLLNTGLRGNGSVNPIDRYLLTEIGKWIRKNKGFLYEVRSCEIEAENAYLLQGKDCFYAVVKNVFMSADPNVAIGGEMRRVTIKTEKKIRCAKWLDNGREIPVSDNSFSAEPFAYGESLCVRVAKLTFEE